MSSERSRKKLTKRVVDGLEPDPKRDYIVWDTEVLGFALRIKASGVKSYLVNYRNATGRSRRCTLGRHGVLTPDEARTLARAHLGDVARGADPAGSRAAERAGPTVAMLAARYLEEHARLKKKPSSVKMDEINLRKHVLPALGRHSVTEVSRADVARLHHSMRATPGAANRVLALLSKLMNLAEKWELRPDGSNPCRHVERNPEHKLERFLSEVELARLGDALAEAVAEGLASPAAVSAIRLLALTGMRLGEVLSLRWGYLDEERSELRLPDSKTGPRPIPLNPPALQLLGGLERHGEWVFPGQGLGQHLTTLRKPWVRIRARAGLQDVRLHDLRHTYASVGVGAQMGLPVIGALLGHTQASTTQRYAHLSDHPLRKATDAIGARIAGALDGRQDAEVTDISTGKSRPNIDSRA